jgi:phosphoserine phosphatase RsbU/P
MRVLIAEDDTVSRRMLEHTLIEWGYDVVSVTNGDDAWTRLTAEDAPQLAILDWMMPGLTGIEICERVSALDANIHVYIILLTARTERADIIRGLDAGANDYVRKPFDKEELLARLRVGERVIDLQCTLAERIEDLMDALAHVKTLQGLLPLCARCHKIRGDEEVWHSLEHYISEHSEAQFSHSLCPQCFENEIEQLKRLEKDLL